MKNTITKVKITLQGINSTIGEAQNPISGLEYKEAENTQSEQQKEKESKKMRMVSGASTTTSILIFT